MSLSSLKTDIKSPNFNPIRKIGNVHDGTWWSQGPWAKSVRSVQEHVLKAALKIANTASGKAKVSSGSEENFVCHWSQLIDYPNAKSRNLSYCSIVKWLLRAGLERSSVDVVIPILKTERREARSCTSGHLEFSREARLKQKSNIPTQIAPGNVEGKITVYWAPRYFRTLQWTSASWHRCPRRASLFHKLTNIAGGAKLSSAVKKIM